MFSKLTVGSRSVIRGARWRCFLTRHVQLFVQTFKCSAHIGGYFVVVDLDSMGRVARLCMFVYLFSVAVTPAGAIHPSLLYSNPGQHESEVARKAWIFFSQHAAGYHMCGLF